MESIHFSLTLRDEFGRRRKQAYSDDSKKDPTAILESIYRVRLFLQEFPVNEDIPVLVV